MDNKSWEGWGPPPTPLAYIERLIATERELRAEEWKGHAEAHRLLAEQIRTVADELKRRLEEMNRFREEAREDKDSFATQEKVDRMDADIRALQRQNSQGAGKELGIAQLVGYAFGAGGLVVAAVSLLR